MATDIERIHAHMTGAEVIEFTDHLRAKYNRIKQMCALLLDNPNDMECIAIYSEITGVEQAQAYRDMADAKKINGDLVKIDTKFELIRMYNWQKQLIKKAENAQQFTAAMSGHRNAQLYLEKIGEGEMIDLTKYKPHTIILTYDHTLLGDGIDLPEDEDALKLLVEKLSKPKTDIETNDYIEFEEINEELRRSSPGTP